MNPLTPKTSAGFNVPRQHKFLTSSLPAKRGLGECTLAPACSFLSVALGGFSRHVERHNLPSDDGANLTLLGRGRFDEPRDRIHFSLPIDTCTGVAVALGPAAATMPTGHGARTQVAVEVGKRCADLVGFFGMM